MALPTAEHHVARDPSEGCLAAAVQVLDARDPLGCRCPDVERYIRSTSPNKRIILLLNKMDLVPREVGEQWLTYFR